jgi:hypothetical protein
LGRKTAKLKKLQNGEFLYYHRNKIDKIEIQPYENTTAKTEIVSNTKPKLEPLPTPKPKADYGALIKFVVIAAIGIAFLLGAV